MHWHHHRMNSHQSSSVALLLTPGVNFSNTKNPCHPLSLDSDRPKVEFLEVSHGAKGELGAKQHLF